MRRPLAALALASLYALGATLLSGRSAVGDRASRPSGGAGDGPDRHVSHDRIAGRAPPNDPDGSDAGRGQDVAPGDARGDETSHGLSTYLIGLGLAAILTAASFYVTGTTLIWGPGIPLALIVLAIAQMGVHLVFFLHIDTSPDSTNNVMALAFGMLIVILVVAGSLWIMANLNSNMMPMEQIMRMQR